MKKEETGTLKIVQMKISDVHPYEKNPRLNDNDVEPVAKSIAEFGFRSPIVVDKDHVIICGHTRLKAAQRLGLETVPVHVAADLTPEQTGRTAYLMELDERYVDAIRKRYAEFRYGEGCDWEKLTPAEE